MQQEHGKRIGHYHLALKRGVWEFGQIFGGYGSPAWLQLGVFKVDIRICSGNPMEHEMGAGGL